MDVARFSQYFFGAAGTFGSFRLIELASLSFIDKIYGLTFSSRGSNVDAEQVLRSLLSQLMLRL